MNVRIAITDSSNVALEVADIDWIKSYLAKTKNLVLKSIKASGEQVADNGHEESDIGLGQAVTDEVSLALQYTLDTVKGFEER